MREEDIDAIRTINNSVRGQIDKASNTINGFLNIFTNEGWAAREQKSFIKHRRICKFITFVVLLGCGYVLYLHFGGR